MSKTGQIWVALLVAASVLGCSMGDTLATVEVLNHGNCQTLESGISVVSYADIAKIRGSKLIDMTVLEQPSETPDLLLLAVSNGEQPTPGYQFSLADAYLNRETAVIEIFWTEPEADAVLPQVMTHPCLVVGMETGSYRRVQVIDHTGKLIGELSL